MSARALWEGVITFEKLSVPVKLYSAVVDRDVHFHLLHKTDNVRLQQRMVNANTQATVDRADVRKAFPLKDGSFVLIEDGELDALAPEPSRTIEVLRFVPSQSIALEWYDRPYYLGPVHEHEDEYAALADALAKRSWRGIVRWVMRKKGYAGALCSEDGHLLLTVLHHAAEVVAIEDLERPSGRELSTEENRLAERLVQSLEGNFDPSAFHDDYQDEVRKLVEAKQRGKKLPARRKAKPRKESDDIADALRRSVRTARS